MNRAAAQARRKEKQNQGAGLLAGAINNVRSPSRPLLIGVVCMTSLWQMGSFFSSPNKKAAVDVGDKPTSAVHDDGGVLHEFLEQQQEEEREEEEGALDQASLMDTTEGLTLHPLHHSTSHCLCCSYCCGC